MRTREGAPAECLARSAPVWPPQNVPPTRQTAAAFSSSCVRSSAIAVRVTAIFQVGAGVACCCSHREESPGSSVLVRQRMLARAGRCRLTTRQCGAGVCSVCRLRVVMRRRSVVSSLFLLRPPSILFMG